MVISVNIPDTIKDRVINAICAKYNYQVILQDGSNNPVTKSQFARQQLIEWLKITVKEIEANQAADTARLTAINNIETEINIT